MNLKQATQPKPAAKKRGKYLATRYGDIVRYESNNLLYLYFKHKGKRYEYSLEAVARIKADAETKAIKARVQEGALVSDGKITLGEILTHFLNTQARRVEAHEIKRRTYEAIEDGVKKIRREQAPLLVREAAG